MTLGLNDLHCMLDAAGRQLKLFDANGHLLFRCEARNRTTADGQYGHDGNCPPGEYLLGVPSPRGTVPFGAWFVPLLDYGDHHGMADHGRSGIGVHGGGSGLSQPFAPRQGWQITYGCWRLQNEDLGAFVKHINECQQDGGQCFVTVVAPVPGAVVTAEVDDWGPVVALTEGE